MVSALVLVVASVHIQCECRGMLAASGLKVTISEDVCPTLTVSWFYF